MHALNRLAATFALGLATACRPCRRMAEEPRYNQVRLRAEVSREVPHDRMYVTLYTEAQSGDPAALASDVTKTLNAAIDKARKVQGVKVSLGSRQSYPVYEDEGQQDQRLARTRRAAPGKRRVRPPVAAVRRPVGRAEDGRDELRRGRGHPQDQRGQPDQGSGRSLQGPRPAGHRGGRRQGLQAGQPEPQQRWLPAGDADARHGHGPRQLQQERRPHRRSKPVPAA